MDTREARRDNPVVVFPGHSRRRIARTLSAAYAGGLLSEETFDHRIDEVLSARVIRPRLLVGDLSFRERTPSRPGWLAAVARLLGKAPTEPPTWLALDSYADRDELLVGRHAQCDIVLASPTVSRRHARLINRDGRWVLQDLSSTNGSFVNGARVGRCQLQPGDRLRIGDHELLID